GYLCNDYGIDTVSCGSTIAFAMECFEKGILTEKDTGGINLSFGNKSAIIEMVKRIAERKDIGNLLAEGTRIMSGKLKKGSEKFAMHVRGMELACYDPRAAKLTGLAYVTANRGGDHITAFVEAPTFLATPFLIIDESEIRDILKEDPEDVKILKDLEDALTTFDAAGSCKFMGMTLTAEEWVEIIRVTTGWEDYTVDEFRKTGERIYNLARACNVRDGVTRADDKLPYRLTDEPMPDGPAKGETVNLKELLKEYYKCRDWDNPEGKPSPEKLNELGLADVREVLYRKTE
ncbi:MAG: aldehyde ferredoxin oxidoreductase C-terminal domain-containing protein, partial [Spirochaetales bacterium]|nr:aldehyde ferredoxin oxidoreductase C-terminal domain-containing protein [Spirochaetales bacterium]